MKRMVAALVATLAMALTACAGSDEYPYEDPREAPGYPEPSPTVVSFPDSTALRQVTYDPRWRTLLVEFKDRDGMYLYCRVPEEVFEGLIEADSAGSYFYDHIADEYDTAVEIEPGSWACT